MCSGACLFPSTPFTVRCVHKSQSHDVFWRITWWVWSVDSDSSSVLVCVWMDWLLGGMGGGQACQRDLAYSMLGVERGQ